MLLLTDILRLTRGELEDAGEGEWSDGELEPHIAQTLYEISMARPYEVVETVTLTASGKNEVSISSITDLISITHAEYPVDQDPRELRNVKVFGSTATIVTNRRPSGDESAYLYCHKLHTLTELTSTLSPDLERILVLGSAARAARSKSRKQINRVNIGGSRVPTSHLTWAEVTQAKYKAALHAKTKQRITQFYPED